jgi:hypothetical protein
MNSKVSKREMISLYEKMGLVEVTSMTEENNGTVKFFDETSQSNYIFRKYSAPRVEYISDKTNTIQSYALIETHNCSETLAEDMLKVLPKIVNRKVKSAYKRSLIAINISKNLVDSFVK